MRVITFERTVPVPAGDVWAAWTQAERFNAWFWPERFAARCAIDARVGGRWSIVSDVAEIGVGGSYVEVSEPDRLVFGWTWDGDDVATNVTVSMADASGSTLVTVIHEGLTGETVIANHVDGWNSCLDRLGPYLTT